MNNRPMQHFVGLDLGQSNHFTALAVLERPLVHPYDPPEQRRPAYALRHLRRFPLGCPYPELTQEVARLLRAPELKGCALGVDQTGVGQAQVSLLAEKQCGQVFCFFYPITITAGQIATIGGDGSLQVPKKDLIGLLQLLLQTRRLHVARQLPDAAVLVQELENFRMRVPLARPEVLESWREGQHDDLVLALALAAWLGEQALPQPGDEPEETTLERIYVA
jgi:hypothetical protein